jgi:hypothetical protein
LCDRLGVIGALDAAVGPIKRRDRGLGAGELLTGIAAAQLAGEDFLTGLDRQRADAAGQQITPVPGLASTTAAGLARRITPAQWKAVETGLAAVTGRMLSLLPAPRAAALTDGPVTIDLDATDVEVYGRKKRGVAYNHQGQRVGRPHVATWAETETVLAVGLGDGTDDPRATAPGLLRRALASLPRRARRSGRVAMRADAGYFAGQLARAAHDERIAFAIGAKRIALLWRLLGGIAGDDWHDAIDMDNAQVAVAGYCPDWWPAKLVEFLNEQMPRVEVLALEIRQYRQAGSSTGALVPRLIGQTARAQAVKEPAATAARRSPPWTVEEVLEAIASAGPDVAAVARTVRDWAAAHPHVRITGGRGVSYPSLTMAADSGRGASPFRAVLSLYGALTSELPMLEVRIRQMCSIPPYDRDEARVRLTADLRAPGIPRLDARDAFSSERPNIPLNELTGGRIEALLSVVDRWIETVREAVGEPETA